jgi:hypothetical protein
MYRMSIMAMLFADTSLDKERMVKLALVHDMAGTHSTIRLLLLPPIPSRMPPTLAHDNALVLVGGGGEPLRLFVLLLLLLLRPCCRRYAPPAAPSNGAIPA